MLLLSDGLIIDGSGGEPYVASVLIQDGRIADIGHGLRPSEATTVDCTGLAIAPGFIDLHSHCDLQVLENRSEKLKQGVTTEVVGNCGFSPFPDGGHPEELREFAGGILGRSGDWGWPSAAAYFEKLHATNASDWAAPLVGHGSLRVAVCGMKQTPVTKTELDRMTGLLEDSLDAGCAGFSTGLMYAPGSSADADELAQLCRVVAQKGKLYATHMRSYSAALPEAIDEQLSLAERTGCKLQISHLQTAGRENWHLQRPALERIEAAVQRGMDVEFDIYPYQCGSTVLTQYLPQWTLDGGNEPLLGRLNDTQTRRDILTELDATPGRWGDITISAVATAANQAAIGKTVEQIAAERQVTGAVCMLDLLLEEHGAVNIIAFNQSEENLRELITHPLCSVITDGFYVSGNAHPRLYGTYPELLGSLVRERGWLPLREAIHKSTGKPAVRAGLTDRGFLRPGLKADITVFDAARVASRSTYDAPAAEPIGIRFVIKNGAIVHQR